MSEVAIAADPIMESDFVREMVRQMRAIDTYGTYDEWSVEKIIAPFVMTKEKRRDIPVIGDPDEIVMARVKAYYNAIAASIEQECGKMAVPIIHLSHEGFGRAVITVGKLVVTDRTLRDVHRFGFATLEKMQAEFDKIVDAAVATIAQYGDAAAA